MERVYPIARTIIHFHDGNIQVVDGTSDNEMREKQGQVRRRICAGVWEQVQTKEW